MVAEARPTKPGFLLRGPPGAAYTVCADLDRLCCFGLARVELPSDPWVVVTGVRRPAFRRDAWPASGAEQPLQIGIRADSLAHVIYECRARFSS
jgi:hypothetical protein